MKLFLQAFLFSLLLCQIGCRNPIVWNSSFVPSLSSKTNIARTLESRKKEDVQIKWIHLESANEAVASAQEDSSLPSSTIDELADVEIEGKDWTFEKFEWNEGKFRSSRPRPSLLGRLANDQLHFYSGESLVGLSAVFAGGAIVANSNWDQQIQKHFQASVRGATSDEWFEFLHANKELGNGVYVLPLLGTAWMAGEFFDESESMKEIGTWGERSIRSFVVGAPPLLVMQRITGGARPDEASGGSHWNPMRDNNGVSGHAFMSSIPFITAAKMTDDPWKKTLWYAGSAIGPLSRVNDNAHYPSQIGLGWAMAYFAASAVQQTDTGERGFRLLGNAPNGDSGVSVQYRW